MPTTSSPAQQVSGSILRALKVRKIFERFDTNRDGRLSRGEMAALVAAVNPRVRFSQSQITAILDEVFRTYEDFIDRFGLSFHGLLRTYEDGAGDVDRDFDALHLELHMDPAPNSSTGYSKAMAHQAHPNPPPPPPNAKMPQRRSDDEASRKPHQDPDSGRFHHDHQSNACAPHQSGNHYLLEELHGIIYRMEEKLASSKLLKKESSGDDGQQLHPGLKKGTSKAMNPMIMEGKRRGVNWEELGHDYADFQREWAEIHAKAAGVKSVKKGAEEVFDAMMGLGRALFDHGFYAEALVSFKRANEAKPNDVRPHFRVGNTLYALGRPAEAKKHYLSALDAAYTSTHHDQWSCMLPHIHLNLGVALEAEGMLLSASEHYKEAAIREPKHYRALKLLGSALYGVGEYRAAEKALMEAIFLRSDYADAHCDLGSTLHAMGDDERAIHEFQKAIDLKPDHMDALYNLGGLFRDIGRFRRAAEMYTKVLALQPNHWRAQLNKAVSLLGAGEPEEARKSLEEAFRMTNRIELYDALMHLKRVDHKRLPTRVGLGLGLRLGLGLGLGFGSILTKRGEANSIDESLGHVIALEDAIVVEEDSCFKQATRNTTPRGCLRSALEIRRLQRETRLGRCDVRNAKKELIERPVWPAPAVSSHSSGNNSSSSSSSSVKSIRKEELEQVLRRLLPFLKPDAFQCAVKAINGHILGVLEGGAYSSGRVDIGLFLALIAPICSGPRDKRKMVVFDALAWRRSSSSKDLPKDVVPKSDVSLYLRWLRAIYFPVTTRVDGKLKIYPHPQQASTVSFPDFVSMFDDPNSGFGILDLVSKLENSDNVRHYGQTCVVCSYPITGNWFKEVSLNFNLCCLCYSEGKVPRFASKRTEYYFKELSSEAEGMKEKLCLFRSRSLAHKTK